jgi:hypothetical protein
VTKLGFGNQNGLKNLNEGAKNSKNSFVIFIILYSNKNVIRIYVSLVVKVLEAVTKFGDINLQCVTKIC